MTHSDVFNRLWQDYTYQNPSTQKIFDIFTKQGEVIQNDHIAFRTFNDPRLDISVLARIFQKTGYVEKGSYIFEEKHLFAKHYEHSTDKYAPRVFISQLILEDFSPFLRKTITDGLNSIPFSIYSSDNLIFTGCIFNNPSYITYQKLLEESEYAAWVYAFGLRANHFTISVNSLSKFNTLEKVNAFVKENGFRLNAAGGEIKGTKEELLRQSSTLADHVRIDFIEGSYDIPSCYYEFAERHPDKNGNLYSGFIAKSADKIFESTNFYKK